MRVTRIGWSSVSELLAPERSRSGATTVTSPTAATHDTVDVRPAPPLPDAAHTRADERAALEEIMTKPLAELALDLADPLSYARPGASKRVLRQIGRGHFSVRAEIDLHRMTSA